MRKVAMKIAVVGAGAVGSVVAGVLARGGLDVRLIERNAATVARIAEHGLRLAGVRGEFVVRLPICCDAREAGPVDLVVFCVKAYDTEAAVAEHGALLTGGATAMSLQNGIGNVEQLAARFGADRALAGSTTLGANVRGPGAVEFAGEGDTRIGEARGGRTARVEEIAAAWTAAGLPTQAVADIRETLWAKLCVNAAGNPLSALLRVRNRDLAQAAPLRPLAQAIIAEAVAVAAAVGVRLDAAALVERLWQIVEKTADNKTSMLADFAAGRPTEIEAINGAVVRLGRDHGVPTPVNETLAQLIAAATEIRRAL